MKRMLAMLLALCLAGCLAGAACAECVEANMIDQLRNVVREYLDAQDYKYEYDESNAAFCMAFGLDCALDAVDVTIYLYDDMVAVFVDCPLPVSEESFEKAAIFTTLANDQIHYAQFRINRESGILTCRSCQIVETVAPDLAEIGTLLNAPLYYMEAYGDGIAAVCAGGDPYQAFAP